MDFSYSEEQEAVRQLAGQIFSERSTHDRLKEVEAAAGDDGPFDRSSGRSWPTPACSASTWARTSGAPVSTSWRPVWSWRLRAARRPTSRSSRPWSTARCPSTASAPTRAQDVADRRGQWRNGPHAAMAELVGEVILPGGSEPATTATAEADGAWVLSGTKACVPAAPVADAILVPATCRTPEGRRPVPACSSWSGAPRVSS